MTAVTQKASTYKEIMSSGIEQLQGSLNKLEEILDPDKKYNTKDKLARRLDEMFDRYFELGDEDLSGTIDK